MRMNNALHLSNVTSIMQHRVRRDQGMDRAFSTRCVVVLVVGTTSTI